MSRAHGVLAPFRSLLTAQLLGTGLGLLFWVLVARLVPAQGVGAASAAISTQTLVGSLVAMGLGTFLVAALPGLDPGRQRVVLLRGLLVACVGAGGLALVVALLGAAGLLGGALGTALAGPGSLTLFVLGVVAAAAGVVTDEATLGLGRSSWQVWRNLLAAGARFPVAAALVAAGVHDQLVLQACWVAPLALSVVLVVWRVAPRGRPSSRPSLLADLRSHASAAAHHQVLTLAVAAATQLVPVVAALVLPAEDNAAFALAWLAATFAFLPPYLLSVALFAHGSRAGTRELRRSVGTTLPAGLALSGVLVLGAWVLGRPVMALFGDGYAESSSHLLALLVPAGLWMVVKDHVVVVLRAEQRFALASRLAVAALVLELLGAAVGGLAAGAAGVAVGWTSSLLLEAVLASRLVRRTLGGCPWVAPTPRRLLVARASQQDLGEDVGEDVPDVAEQADPPRPSTVAAAGDRGAVSLRTTSILLGLLVLAMVAALAVVTVRGRTATPDDDDLTASVCTPDDAEPGPLVDLGVEASTGRAAHPVRSQAAVDRLVSRAADAGADVISTSVAWQAVEPEEGRWRWTAVDRVVRSARAAGLEVRIVLSGSPAWALGTGDGSAAAAQWRPPTTPAELKRWRTFVAAVARHLAGRVAYVEVWSEPDNDEYWTTGADPAAYAALLEATTPTLRRLLPAAQVVTGGLDGNDLGYLRRVYAALGEARPFDLVGVHPWPGSNAPDAVDDAAPYQGTFGAYDDTFLGYRDLWRVLVAHGDSDLGLYIGELGYSTRGHDGVAAVSDATRAGYLTEAYGLATCTPYVTALSWYYLHPTPWNPASWTLLDRAGRPNRTYDALRAWTGGRS
ncbi:beta-galactosidase [Nocardioides sp. GY 10127]|uniref:beta-galactosidase n=1 Tax=Nocardioides sp. GY 10127 TaxID=2569762 RepID=UPI0010A89034|nr:beta-galactosidase [Nocardioides sp. GY 10127]TIC86551.1 hypothetical protein E8D37_01285 [Nocardioides sp. GY 10127]